MSYRKEIQKIKIFHNVTGYTVKNDSLSVFHVLAFDGAGRVLGTGNEELIDKYPDAVRFDGGGNILLPGLIDAHGHVLGLGYSKIEVDLSGIQSLDEIRQILKRYVEENPAKDWITGRGWNHALWNPANLPSAAILDAIIPEKPVWLRRVDSHAGWANSRALKRAGIDEHTPDPEGGKILRDAGGHPTGVLVDEAMSLIDGVIPAHTESEDGAALQEALNIFKSCGLTSVHDPGIVASNYNLYKSFVDKGKMTARIYAMILGVGENFDGLAENGPVEGYGNDLLALRSVKLFTDGALGSRGAALLEPYGDEPDNNGLLFYSDEELSGSIRKATKKGFQVNIHAIGDRANRQVLNAFERIEKEQSIRALRNRIEHAQIVSLDDIPRFKDLDIIASVQPTHATSDMNMAESRLGKKRMAGAYAWHQFEKQDTIVAGGSDFPVESANPFLGLYAAVTRQDLDGNPEGGWYPEEKMTRFEAFKAFTVNAAYAAFQEDVIGSLEPGKWADFILVDTDIFKEPLHKIWQTKVLQTWLAGEKIYQNEDRQIKS